MKTDEFFLAFCEKMFYTYVDLVFAKMGWISLGFRNSV